MRVNSSSFALDIKLYQSVVKVKINRRMQSVEKWPNIL